MKKRCWIAIMLVALLFFCGCGAGKGYSKTEKEERFSQLDALQMNGPEEVLSRFPEKNIFLLGEMHGVKESFEIELAFLEAMAKEHTEIQIVLEFSPCKIFALKQYIETGDEDILLESVKNSKGSYAFHGDYQKFFQKIREFHEKGISLHLIGIDQEFSALDVILALELLNKDRFSLEIEKLRQAQKDAITSAYRMMEYYARKWRETLTDSSEDEELERIIEGMEDAIDASKRESHFRDEAMFQRFNERVNPELPTFGIFGSTHLAKKVSPPYKTLIPDAKKTLGQYLVEDSIYTDRLVIGNMYYVDSAGMDVDGRSLKIYAEIPKGELLIDHALERRESTVWYQTKGLPQNLYDEPLEHWCDFVMIVKNAQPTTYFYRREQ
ncbi:MAG: ChaN family lipoprotein [Tissierellia bacterium]|nr:ChaN family lipoprotein [Tissierellia bacterium]